LAIDRGHSIVFIIGQLGQGGSEKQLYFLARELIWRGWRVMVINLNPGAVDIWVAPLEQVGISVYSLSRSRSQMERLVAITSILKREKPLIVHSWSFYANSYAALCGSLARIPVRLGSERGNQEYSTRYYGKCKYSLSLIGIQGIITNSELEARMLHNKKPGLRVVVIPNAVDEGELMSRTKAREFLGAPDGNILVAGIGSLTPNKNFGYLIEIFAKIVPRNPTAMLVFIGDGPEKKSLFQKASSLIPGDRFQFTGLVPGAHRLFPGIDILCVSSLTEGMPNVVLEACAAGIPVVANKVGAIPSLVIDGVNGFLIDVDDENGYTSAIEKLVENGGLRREMGSSGQRLMRTEFGIGRMADRFASFYKEIVDS
jgi:glycosyltransferase involved in cell wall biosynthesis